MSEEQESKPFGRNTCHVCGGTEFTWTDIVTGKAYLRLALKDAGFLDKAVGGWFPSARVCNTCGNVQIFVDSVKK